jgi:anti-anti-sigma factor
MSPLPQTVTEVHNMSEPFRLVGEVDIGVVPSMAEDLLAYVSAIEGDVHVDCSQMTFIDSSGLAMLVGVHRSLNGRQLLLHNISASCLVPLRVSGLDTVFLAAAPPAADQDGGSGRMAAGDSGAREELVTVDERDDEAWAAEKRDFVADWRERVADICDADADARDHAADERERLADARDDELDEQERRLDARATQLRVPPRRTPGARRRAAEQRASAATQRNEQHAARRQRRDERDAATAARRDANENRNATAATTGLAMAFADIARYLYESDNFDDVLTRIVETTVSTVTGSAMASVTVEDSPGAYRTAASTHTAAVQVDDAQYQTREGPCLDAIDETLVHAPAFPDPRWPTLGARPTRSGIHAVASYGVAMPADRLETSLPGSLNVYAAAPHAYDERALEIGIILAAHASVAARAVHRRDALELLGTQLRQALTSRDVIGQAKGILMERLKMSPEEAFDTLRRSSQQLNIKLRERAQRLTETGQINPKALTTSGGDASSSS